MYRYKALKTGFYDGRLYEPDGKRPILHRDKPFPKDKDGKEKVPSWLEPIAKETAPAKKKRQAAAKKTKAAAEKKAEQDKKDIEEMSFMGEGESAKSSNVETL